MNEDKINKRQEEIKEILKHVHPIILANRLQMEGEVVEGKLSGGCADNERWCYTARHPHARDYVSRYSRRPE